MTPRSYPSTPDTWTTSYSSDFTRTNPDNILQYVDTIHSNIQLSPTMESENNIYFLDLSKLEDQPALT